MGAQPETNQVAWAGPDGDPTDVELWSIEAETELLAAELALVDAELAWCSRPGPLSAACYLEALAVVTDLWDSFGCGSGKWGRER